MADPIVLDQAEDVLELLAAHRARPAGGCRRRPIQWLTVRLATEDDQ